jgi:hypothetical protein
MALRGNLQMKTDMKIPEAGAWEPPAEDEWAVAVQALLSRLGLGFMSIESTVRRPGRNRNVAGRTNTGNAVFVKQMIGQPVEAAERFTRLSALESQTLPRVPINRPRCLGWSDATRMIAYEWLPEAESCAALASDKRLTGEMSREIGHAIGVLHGLPPAGLGELSATPPAMPPLDLFEALPVAQWALMSHAMLETWALLHRDRAVVDALTGLRREEAAAPRVPSHADLRLDQVLLHDDELWLTDWEEFRFADPARDIGSYVGEWLYRAILQAASKEDDESLDHETIMRRGVEELDRVRPLNIAFVAGYRAAGSPLDDDTARRAVGFAGWHIFERLLAGAVHKNRLSAVERAAAGVGRSAILNAGDLIETLGLKQAA